MAFEVLIARVTAQAGSWLAHALGRARDERQQRIAHVVRDAGTVVALMRGTERELRSFLVRLDLLDPSTATDPEQRRELMLTILLMVESRIASTAICQAQAGLELTAPAPKPTPKPGSLAGFVYQSHPPPPPPHPDDSARDALAEIDLAAGLYMETVWPEKARLAEDLLAMHRQGAFDLKELELIVGYTRDALRETEPALQRADEAFGRLRAWLIQRAPAIPPPDWATGE